MIFDIRNTFEHHRFIIYTVLGYGKSSICASNTKDLGRLSLHILHFKTDLIVSLFPGPTDSQLTVVLRVLKPGDD